MSDEELENEGAAEGAEVGRPDPEGHPSEGPAADLTQPISPEAPDPDATVAAPLDDPDATVLATAATDAKTVVAGAEPTHVLSSDAAVAVGDEDETFVVPVARRPYEGPDGIDALDDPYAPIISGEDLTQPVAPVSIGSPVTEVARNGGRAHALAIALVATLITGMVAFFVYQAYQSEHWGGKTVPNVVGKTRTEALSMLAPLGFDVTVDEVISDDTPGIVISTDPGPGARTGANMAVTITVAVARSIPNVIGMSLEDAKKALYDAGAKNISIEYVNSDEPEGTVVSVDPSVGKSFKSGDAIKLGVAQPFTVPNVVGLSLESAQRQIEAAGLKCAVSYDTADTGDKSKANKVISTDPAAGTVVAGGTTVTITVPAVALTDPYHLVEYFGISGEDLSSYLEEKGFSFVAGSALANGDASAAFSNGAVGIAITDTPATQEVKGIRGSENALAKGAPVGGVRLEGFSSSLPFGPLDPSMSGLEGLMAACGLSNLTSSCTEGSMRSDVSLDTSGISLVSAYGSQGGYTWTATIGKVGGHPSYVVVTVAPSGYYSSLNLSGFGNDLASYMAATTFYDLESGGGA